MSIAPAALGYPPSKGPELVSKMGGGGGIMANGAVSRSGGEYFL